MLDLFLFVFILQYFFYINYGLVKVFYEGFLGMLKEVFRYSFNIPISYLFSFFIFVILLIFCFGGYFSYSFCICGMLEFTLFYSLVAWLSTLLIIMSSNKISVYLSKSGDVFLKTFTMLIIEVVSELSRPVALTIRLTVNVIVGHLIVAMLYVGLQGVLGEMYIWFTVFAIIMECFVFFIQSYIFSRLVYLYLNE